MTKVVKREKVKAKARKERKETQKAANLLEKGSRILGNNPIGMRKHGKVHGKKAIDSQTIDGLPEPVDRHVQKVTKVMGAKATKTRRRYSCNIQTSSFARKGTSVQDTKTIRVPKPMWRRQSEPNCSRPMKQRSTRPRGGPILLGSDLLSQEMMGLVCRGALPAVRHRRRARATALCPCSRNPVASLNQYSK